MLALKATVGCLSKTIVLLSENGSNTAALIADLPLSFLPLQLTAKTVELANMWKN